MKILVVVDSLDVDRSSGARANAAIVANLCSEGFDVDVLHYSHRDIDGFAARLIRVRERKFNFMYLLSRSQRVLQRTFRIELAPLLERMFGFSFTFFNDVSSLGAAIRNQPVPDVVLTLSQAGSFRPHAALLKFSRLHSRWLAYVHDPYPFHRYPHPYNWTEPSYRHKEIFFRKITESAQWLGFPSELLANWMTSYFPAITGKAITIPHQLTERVVGDHPFVPKDVFTVLHAGSLLKQRSPSALLEGFRLFLSRSENIDDKKLLLVGPADYHNSLLQSWEGKKGYHIVNGNVPFDESLKLQNAASVNVILEAVSEISPFLPGKFPHCVATGKPILHIGPVKSEVMRLLGSEYPYHAEADDPATIAGLLDTLYHDWKSGGFSRAYESSLLHYLSSSHLRETISSLKA